MNRVKIAILLSSIFLLQPLGKIRIYISFRINQDYISKNFCVQRQKTNNCCKGQCYLFNQLKGCEKENQNNIPASEKNNTEQLYFVPFSETKPCNPEIFVSSGNSVFVNDLNSISDYLVEDFKPPENSSVMI
ncbi:MAG: hypothetical protein H6605_06740 [Flavobacteriales bacterium]|nr:hypothetical protein [Flavobacteriales bacterium]